MTEPASVSSSSVTDEQFRFTCARIREELVANRDRFKFWGMCQGRCVFDSHLTQCDLWYGSDSYGQFYVRVVYQKDTLAAALLDCSVDLPEYGVNLEIVGDNVHRGIDYKPFVEDDFEDDSEDVTEELMQLPIVQVDKSQHFVKQPTYKSEIQALLAACGSPHIIRLLGKSEDGLLVFPRYPRHMLFHAAFVERHITRVKDWMLQLVDGVAFLHSKGIIHRDLTPVNILVNPEDDKLVICDLQCRWSSIIVRAPECHDHTNFSTASDVYGIGRCLWCLCYGNNPNGPLMSFFVPPPFDIVYEACTRHNPQERPSIPELRRMLEGIQPRTPDSTVA